MGPVVPACGRYDRPHVERTAGVPFIEMQMHASRTLALEPLQLLQQRRACGTARRVVQLPVTAKLLETRNHGIQRRDADATGNQHAVARFLGQAKVVARCTDHQTLPDSQALVHEPRAPTAVRLQAHRNLIAMALAGGIHQGIVTSEIRWQAQFDVRAGLDGRQHAAVRIAQLEGKRIGGGDRDCVDLDFDGVVSGRHGESLLSSCWMSRERRCWR
ncbi:hypothetical protein D3C72_1384180 [compost metagenome]